MTCVEVMPDFILHMETLEEDVKQLLEAVGLGQFAPIFPHTHRQKGDRKIISWNYIKKKFIHGM
jgi:hypothetical protein